MKRRVKITYPLPKAVSGMTVTGKINNMDGSQAGKGSLSFSGDMSEPDVKINRTLKPTDREDATLEAEKGETVVTNLAQTGIPEFYTIGGKRHSQGGTPLNLPPDSFIFSRDKKMVIKDPEILAQFGKSIGKKGKKKFTFAELSKPFDNGIYRKILADSSSDHYQIDTAEKMIQNYNLKLGALALLQESKKGFPDGIPGIAMPYLAHTGIDPSKFELPKMQQGGQPQQQQVPQMSMGRYGGHNYFQGGGGPKLDEIGINANLVDPGANQIPFYMRPKEAGMLANSWKNASESTSIKTNPVNITPFKPQTRWVDATKGRSGYWEGKQHGNTDSWKTLTKRNDYLKKYDTGFDAAEFAKDEEGYMANFNANTGDFANLYNNPTEIDPVLEKEAQLASLTLDEDGKRTLKKFGGDSNIPMYADAGEVNEDDYITASDYYANQNVPAIEAYTNAPNRQQVRVSYPTEAQTSTRATSFQNIPKGDRKWDMTTDGYDEASVKPGDYIKKTDGKWYKAETVDIKINPYEGKLDERLGKDLSEAYGRLEERLLGNEKLQNALYKKYKINMAKAKPRNNLSKADLETARGLSKKEVIDNFLRAQKQIMAVQNKGPLENADAWDKDLSHYQKAVDDMGFTPMNAAETAAFQGAYVSVQNLVDADPKFRKELNEFLISSKTRKGKADEPGGGTGKATISDIDGWFGNTSIGQSLLYAPKTKELQMKEVEWKNAAEDPSVKPLIDQGRAGKTPFWTQDKVNLAFAGKGLFGIREEQPWMAKARSTLPRARFITPDQQIQNILGAQAKGIRGASNIGSPQAYAATIASIQSNAMQNVANAIGNVHDRNINIENQFEVKRTQIRNNAHIRDAQLATTMHDKRSILNQQTRNSKNKAWDVARRTWNNMWGNRGTTDAINEMSDQFAVDPRTGFVNRTGVNRALIPKNANQQDLAYRANQLLEAIPGLSKDAALAQANKEKNPQQYSPSGGMGVDPSAFAYPPGQPSGYS